MQVGLSVSFGHNQNGMTMADMLATLRVAERLDEVIIFRSTGPWAKRWLERGYPSKNFHVKGKSSDWGPQAGLVPYDGTYSKVGYDPAKAAAGTHKNDEGLASGFAGKQALLLSMDQINEQLSRAEGAPARTAINRKIEIPKSKDFLLEAYRSGDRKPVLFRAMARDDGLFAIRVYAPEGLMNNAHVVLDRDPTGAKAQPLEVMTSSEIGAGQAMTGDYDLFAICPAWGQYGSLSSRAIAKPAIRLADGTLRDGLSYEPGLGMDNVLDPRLHTMSKQGEYANRQAVYKSHMRSGKTGALSPDSLNVIFDGSAYTEHGDMGNLTPRILRCINELNIAMGAVGAKAALRRVHHNAESHRYRAFGALSAKDMVTKKDGEQYGDGFPLTVFQPSRLYRFSTGTTGVGATGRYGDVCTLEDLADFRSYATVLKAAGYFVPKNWIWG